MNTCEPEDWTIYNPLMSAWETCKLNDISNNYKHMTPRQFTPIGKNICKSTIVVDCNSGQIS
jgi:hypothetical protein